MRAAILLAAGRSARFGRADKRLARLGGVPLILHAVRVALASRPVRLIVVIDAGGGPLLRLLRSLRGPRIRILRAIRSRDGMGASLAAGLATLRPMEREVLIFLADMPFACAPPRLRLAGGLDAVRPALCGVPGHPMLVRTSAARRAVAGGDTGLAGRLDRNRIAQTPGKRGNLIDLDTPAAMRHARPRRDAPSRRR